MTAPRQGAVALTLQLPDGARTQVDGQSVGEAPLPVLYLDPGVHRFRIAFPDGHVRSADRELRGETHTIVFDR